MEKSMALTNAEKQAAFKQRKDALLTAQQEQINALTIEAAELRQKLDAAKDKIHALELKLLKAQLKAK
jgi:predicted RNase H-like nuclease (RuvC/YqgF family)